MMQVPMSHLVDMRGAAQVVGCMTRDLTYIYTLFEIQ